MSANRSLWAAMQALAVGIPFLLAGAASAQTTLKLIPQADLKILDPIWSSANITLTTTTSGNVILTGTTMAAGDTVTINSVGSINGAGLVTANTVDLNAVTGIGNTTA